MFNRLLPGLDLLSKGAFRARLPKEEENLISKSPDKLGEALAQRHLQIVNKAVEEWAKERGSKGSTPRKNQTASQPKGTTKK